MKWNQAQQKAIQLTGKNFLVSAAAGSGKTAVLVERIKYIIQHERIGIDEMLIVTFTNAAAAEMKERLYHAFSEAIEKEGEKDTFLRDQLERIGNANISTFHAFCMEVIRRYFYLTQASADFRICDEIQKKIFQEAAMDELLDRFFEEKNENFLEFAAKFATAGNETAIRNMVLQTYEFIQSLPEPLSWLSEKVEQIKESSDEIERETYEDGLMLFQLVEQFGRIYGSKKKEKSLLDFNDIEHMALNILEQEEPRREYQAQFQYLFIDEYQDSSILQETLINRIKRDDNVFMVGDVKQSIYKFRLAEPELFLNKYERYKNGEERKSEKIDLNQNFRSKPTILEGINHIFTDIMKKEVAGMDYDAEAMLYPGFIEEEISAPVRLHLVDTRNTEEYFDEEIGEMKRAELEAWQVSDMIQEMIGKQYYDQKEKQIKEISYRDIVILLRSFKVDGQVFQEVLQQQGIPVYAEGGNGYFDALEVAVFTNLLKVIENRRQDIPLISVLHSAIFGFSPEELAEIRSHFPQGLFSEGMIWYSRQGSEQGLKEKCQSVLEKLDEWLHQSRYLPLKDFLWRLADESLFYEFIGALPQGAQRKANLRALMDTAEGFQNSTTKGLFGFITYLDQMKQSKIPVPLKSTLGEKDDMVQLMTVHKSKGLEFPVVIFAGLGKRFNHQKPTGDLSLDRELGLAIRYRNAEKGYYVKTPLQRKIDEVKYQQELAEEMRILYVAMTRAKERLLLVGNFEKEIEEMLESEKEIQKATCFLDWILPSFHRWQEAFPEKAAVTISSRHNMEGKRNIESRQERQFNQWMREGFPMETEEEKAVECAVFERMDFVYPYQETAGMPSKLTVSELSRGKGEQDIPSLNLHLRKETDAVSFSAAEKGTITHKVLQYMDVRQIQDDQSLEMLLTQMVEKSLLTEQEVSVVQKELLWNFLKSDLAKRIKSAEQVYKETAFNLLQNIQEIEEGLDTKDDSFIMVQGMVDCFFEEEGEFVLIDYKTDRLKGEMPEEYAQKYRIQMRLYQKAIESSYDKRVKEAYLFFLTEGIAVRMN